MSITNNQRKRYKPLDRSVAEALAAPPGGTKTNGDLVKITVRVPASLAAAIQSEAYALTHHKRRGFQDLVTIFLHYGLEAYRKGNLEVELASRIVEYRIVSKGD
jgi:hypothetical protein